MAAKLCWPHLLFEHALGWWLHFSLGDWACHGAWKTVPGGTVFLSRQLNQYAIDPSIIGSAGGIGEQTKSFGSRSTSCNGSFAQDELVTGWTTQRYDLYTTWWLVLQVDFFLLLKEHCLIGYKGNPKLMNHGLDCDVLVAEVCCTMSVLFRFQVFVMMMTLCRFLFYELFGGVRLMAGLHISSSIRSQTYRILRPPKGRM